LVWAVPSVADLRDRTLPRGLEPAAVRKLLAACDRRRTVGRRDYAILLLLARLGLRRGEVAAMQLEDVDWRAGELLVRGQGLAAGRAAVARSMSVKRWCRICAAARGARAGRCFCA